MISGISCEGWFNISYRYTVSREAGRNSTIVDVDFGFDFTFGFDSEGLVLSFWMAPALDTIVGWCVCDKLKSIIQVSLIGVDIWCLKVSIL